MELLRPVTSFVVSATSPLNTGEAKSTSGATCSVYDAASEAVSHFTGEGEGMSIALFAGAVRNGFAGSVSRT